MKDSSNFIIIVIIVAIVLALTTCGGNSDNDCPICGGSGYYQKKDCPGC